MGEYVFYELRGEAPLPQGAELLPVPVRREMESEVFGGPAVRVGLLPGELVAFLSEYPSLGERYRRTASTLAWLAGVNEGLEGDTRSAERHFVMGLAAEPDNLLTRSNYALVLQLQERNDEALAQYEVVLADPEGAKNPVVSLLAARIYAQQKRFREAYALLKPLGGKLFDDDSYWEMLADMKELADAGDGGGAAASVAAAAVPSASSTPATCTFCGAALELGQKFCFKCGKPVEAPRPAEAAQPARASQPAKTFCPYCGVPVEQGQAFCYKCGKKV